jgi:hypothetical protein
MLRQTSRAVMLAAIAAGLLACAQTRGPLSTTETGTGRDYRPLESAQTRSDPSPETALSVNESSSVRGATRGGAAEREFVRGEPLERQAVTPMSVNETSSSLE